MGQFYAPGKVIAHYDNRRAYRIRLDDTQQEVWAREDSDQFVRAATPTCRADALVTTSQMNPQVSTNEVASLNNQLGLTPLADIRIVRAAHSVTTSQMNPQISTNEVASLNNQLGLTPLADITRECSFLERYGDYCQGYFYGRTFLINGCCPVHECIVVKSYRNLNLNDPDVAISEHVVEINPVFVKAANDYLRGFCQLSLNWHGFVRYPNGAVFLGQFR